MTGGGAPRPPAVRITPKLRKLVNLILPIDTFGNFDPIAGASFLEGGTEADIERAERRLKMMPADDKLKDLQLRLILKGRDTEARQIQRIREIRFNAVDVLEAADRFEILERLDPIPPLNAGL